MDELFSRLEMRIKALMQKHEHLQKTNDTLKQGKLKLLRDKEVLLAKHSGAITQIENMVSRLKSIEKSHDE